jgi:hypothetical protein
MNLKVRHLRILSYLFCCSKTSNTDPILFLLIADLIGLKLANAACFDPRAAENLWKRMDQVSGGGGGSLDFLSTHPSSSNRSVKVREWAEQVSLEWFSFFLSLRPSIIIDQVIHSRF